MNSVRIGFGGGCHWCTEAVFDALRGVEKVEQGFIRSQAPYDTYSEAVLVRFKPEEIDLSVLIEVHLRTHASTSNHAMRGKYRSSIYTFDAKQKNAARAVLAQLQNDFEQEIITEVLPFSQFKMSDERFQNYYGSDPTRPFCTTYIDPKLKLLRQRFARHVSADDATS